MKLILASASPRRRELFSMIGLDFSVIVSEVEEIVPDGVGPDELVMSLAKQKAEAVFLEHGGDCVVGADTIVYLDNEIIGKPRDERDAALILRKLAGRTHTVYTGLAVLSGNDCDIVCDTTDVTFAPMTDAEIDWYISTGEPLDKAGAYGIQGPGGMFVNSIVGNYFTVIGLPLPKLYQLLKKHEII